MRAGRTLSWVLVATLMGAAAYGLAVAVPPEWRRTLNLPGRERPSDANPLVAADRDAFDAWLAAKPGRAREFAAFEAYIAREGFADLLPAWTLLRANANKSARCNAEPFVLPPRALWRNILPALRLVREQAIPAVGRVTVASAYRDPALNACSRGASQSRHLQFSALDLIPVDQPDAPTSFSKLCAAWRKAGAASGWGLGAYYDPARREQNRVGRFHVDGTGWRSWGFDYTSASSICLSR